MDAVGLTAEQAATVAEWSVGEPEFVPLNVYSDRLWCARDWRGGDVLVTQGDSYIHVDPLGNIKECVPPCAEGLS